MLVISLSALLIALIFFSSIVTGLKNTLAQSVTLCNDADSISDHRHDCDDDDYSTMPSCQSGEMRWPSGQCVQEDCQDLVRNGDGNCTVDYTCGSEGPAIANTGLRESDLASQATIPTLYTGNDFHFVTNYVSKYIRVQTSSTTPTLSQQELGILDKLTRLSDAAKLEGKSDFGAAIEGFRDDLEKRFTVGPSSMELEIINNALQLWTKDPGNQWGEGIFDSKDLKMSSPDYATVPASQYKCNAYVAEIIYDATGKVFKAHPSDKEKGKFFPFQAKEWGDPKQSIPNFPVVTDPHPGDIWSNGHHTGIYLGEYGGTSIYISARDDGFGVVGTDSVQYSHGIQIKELPSGGVFRRLQ